MIKVIINNEKLSEEINRYELLNNQNAYLFMSKDTMDALTLTTLPFSNPNMIKNGIICNIGGRKVYLDDELKFGEVEIR